MPAFTSFRDAETPPAGTQRTLEYVTKFTNQPQNKQPKCYERAQQRTYNAYAFVLTRKRTAQHKENKIYYNNGNANERVKQESCSTSIRVCMAASRGDNTTRETGGRAAPMYNAARFIASPEEATGSGRWWYNVVVGERGQKSSRRWMEGYMPFRRREGVACSPDGRRHVATRGHASSRRCRGMSRWL